jgi:hypothetical protein
MRTFDLLGLVAPEVAPKATKIHLATWNGEDDPLTLLRTGGFEEWQRWQTKRNFEREFVVALIDMPETDRWMFGGAYRAKGSVVVQGRTKPGHLYDLENIGACAEFVGRLVCAFKRPSRQSYLNAEAWVADIAVAEILREPVSVEDFPGFKAVHLSKVELDTIIGRQLTSWHAALSSVGGVYLVTDAEGGKLYVGSAYGEEGLWQRWTAYSTTGHAGNVHMRELLRELGSEHASHFQFSILEIADLGSKKEPILKRESHWKRVLLTRQHGLND